MNIKVQYESNPVGRGQYVAKANGQQVTQEYNHALGAEQSARLAAILLASKLNEKGDVVGGRSSDDGKYEFEVR